MAPSLTLVGIIVDRGLQLRTSLRAERITGRLDLSAAPIRTASNNLPEHGRISTILRGCSEINTTAAITKSGHDADIFVAESLGLDPLLLPLNGVEVFW